MGHRIALAMAVVLAVAGCADILVYEVSPPRLSYFDGDFEYATHKGAIVTNIGGDPFAIGSERFGALVRGHMQGASWGAPVEFTASASDRTVPPYKVVAMFNLKPSYDGDDLCRSMDGVETVPPSAARLRLDMAFCFGDAAKSMVWATARNLSGPDDPKFRTLIRDVTLLLIPTFTKQDTDDDTPVLVP